MSISRIIFIIAVLLQVSTYAAQVAPFTERDDLITISAVGDLMLGTDYPSPLKLPEDGGVTLFKASKEYLQSTDIRFGNFEGTLFDGELQPDGKAGGKGRYLFRTPTPYGEHLADAGFNVLSLANNHAKDFGQLGFDSTKEILKRFQIKFSSKDGEVAEFNIKGQRVALIAYDFYPGRRSIKNIAEASREIKRLKKIYKIVIISAHVGAEGESAIEITEGDEIFLGENRGDSVKFARSAVEAGADLILMHGPHVPRAMEIFMNKLIVYSLGNFVTSYGISIAGVAGYAPLLRVALDFDGNFVQGHLASYIQKHPPRTVWDSELKALRLINDLSKKQFPETAPKFKSNGFIFQR